MKSFLIALCVLITTHGLAQTSISSFTPWYGKPGNTITINGNNFNSNANNNIVFFGATMATVNSASSTQLQVTVPSGATYGPITIVNVGTGLSGSSTTSFIPVFIPGKGANIASSDFSANTYIATAPVSKNARLADIDGDGKSDLIITTVTFSNTVQVFRNLSTNGNVVFDAPQLFLGANVMNSMDIGDLDGDGKLDIVTANDDATFSMLRNTSVPGSINFAPRVQINSGNHPLTVIIRDMDGNGRPEIIAPDYNGFVRIYQNLSTPGNISMLSAVAISTANFPTAVAVGDLDGDGKPDVASVSEDNSLNVWRNNTTPGNLLNSFFPYATTAYVSAKPNSLIMGDVDGDGKEDLISGSNNLGLLSVVRNTSTLGNISLASSVSFNSPLVTTPVLSDMNGDGKLDIVMADNFNNTIKLFTNTSVFGSINSSSFAASVSVAADTGPSCIAVGDMDGDSKPDMVVGNQTAFNISAIRNITLPLPISGNALHFDGVNDYVALPNGLVSNLTSPATQAITIEYWFRGSSLQSAVRLQDGNGYIVAGWNNMHIISTDGGTNGIAVGANATDGKWHHVAMTWQRNTTNGFKSYLDGQLVDQRNAANVNLPPVVADAYLGSFLASSEYMNGSLDEVRIYTSALTQTEIQSDMKNTSIASPSTLHAYYNFNHGIASYNNNGITYLEDQSSNGYHATLNGYALNGPTSNWIESFAMVVPTVSAASANTSSSFIANWNAPSVGVVENYLLDVSTNSNFSSFVSGYNGLSVNGTSTLVFGLNPNTNYYYRVRANKSSVNLQGCFSEIQSATTTAPLTPPGNALNFDGVNDYVSLPYGLISSVAASTALTIEFYFKGSEFQNAVRFQSQNLAIVIIAGYKDQGVYKHTMGFIGNGIVSAGINITDNNWHHVAITFAQGQTNGFKSYLDGKFIGQANAPNFGSLYQGNVAYLGSLEGTSQFMNGSMDELRFYNRVLTQAEIQADMLSTNIVAPSNLLAYYNFDIGIADANNTGNTVLMDQSPNAYHAFLGNFGLTGNTSNWVESYALVQPTATAATNVVGSGFTANWTAPANGIVSNYILDVAKDSNFTQPVLGSPFTSSTTSYVVSGYQLDTFYYRVRAQKSNTIGNSMVSNTISVIAGTPPPAAPIGSNVNACDNAAIPNLSVSVPANVTVDWYATATGGTPLQTSSTSYATGQTSGTTTYYAEARDLLTGYVSDFRTAITLRINQTQFNENKISCDNFVWHGNTYTSSGTYSVNYVSSDGCNSTDILNLTINPATIPTISGNAILCTGASTTLSTISNVGWNYCWQNTSNPSSWNEVSTNISGANTTTQDIVMVNNTPYISYIDVNNGKNIFVKKYENGSWQTIGGPVTTLACNNQRLATDGVTTYVALIDSISNSKLSVKKFDGTNWVYVGPQYLTTSFGISVQIQIKNGIPYIAYLESQNGIFKATVKRFINNQWEHVGSPINSPWQNASVTFGFDSNTPYVGFTEVNGTSKATVMKLLGTTWVTVGAPQFTTGPTIVSSLVINNGTPYLAFIDNANGLKASVMKYDGTSWVFVGPGGISIGNAANISMSFYNNEPYISYTEGAFGGKGEVKKFNGTNWNNIGNALFTPGNAPSLKMAIGTDGIPYVVYRDLNNGSITVVQKFDIPCESNSSSFTTNTSAIYQVKVTNTSGCTAVSTPISVTVQPCSASQVKLLIQGYYAGNGTMQPVLLNQGVGSNTSITDNITVELRDVNAPYNLVSTTSSILNTDGTVTANFPSSITGNYYVVIRSRNGIETWSANPITIPTTSTYDFSVAANKAFGNNQTEVQPGVWAVYSGDINQDGSIDAFDYIAMEPDIILGASGYLNTDLDGNGSVDALDYLVIETNIVNGVSLSAP